MLLQELSCALWYGRTIADCQSRKTLLEAADTRVGGAPGGSAPTVEAAVEA